MDIDATRIKRTIAADSFSAQVDVFNDQVWELNLTGDPPAVALRTSFGLRSGGMRLFPRFSMQGITLVDPSTFAESLKILERHTNYLRLECNPISQLNVQLEYWVPSSQVLCGRFKCANLSDSPLNVAVDWAVVLEPLDLGEPMSPTSMGINIVLQGRSKGLFPVFFVTGGPESTPGAHPALQVKTTLGANASRRLTWALAALDSPEASFTLARQSTSLAWDVETVKTAMHEKNTSPEIWPESDFFQESQIKAHQLLIMTPAPNDRRTFLNRRQPDMRNYAPISRREEWVSYSQVTAYDAWMLSRILLPGDPQPFKEIIQSFIDFQQEDGSIPWAINQSGNASTTLTPPLLAGIVCDVHPFLEDKDWLRQVYSPLLRAFKAWLSSNDKKIPTWSNPLQTGLMNSPLDSGKGSSILEMDPRFVHSPALDALLIKECQALIKIAGWLNQDEDVYQLKDFNERLKETLNACWDAKRSTFTYREIETGLSCASEQIHQFTHNGLFKIKRNFTLPRRLTISLPDQTMSSGLIRIHLKGSNGKDPISEEIEIHPRYTGGGARKITSRLFTKLESVEIEGLPPKIELQLNLTGYDCEDISLLLPLWSGVLSDEQTNSLIENTLVPRYLTASGLSTFPVDRIPEQENTVIPFWNHLIMEGLLQEKRRDVAARVMEPLIRAQSQQWTASGYPNSQLSITRPLGYGEMDSLAGLPAIWLLLRVLGIEYLKEKEIVLSGLNDFLPSYTVKYRGTTLTMNSEMTSILTVKDEQIRIKEKGSCKVVLP